MLHGDADTVPVLAHIDDLRALNDRGSGFPCTVAKNRLKARLVQKQSAAGAHSLNALVQVRNDVRELAAREAIHRDDGALRDEVLRRLLPRAARAYGVVETCTRTSSWRCGSTVVLRVPPFSSPQMSVRTSPISMSGSTTPSDSAVRSL